MTTQTTTFFLLFSIFLAETSFTKPMLISNHSFICETVIPSILLQSTGNCFYVTQHTCHCPTAVTSLFSNTQTQRGKLQVSPLTLKEMAGIIMVS